MDTSMLAFRVRGDQRAVSALTACAPQRERLVQSCITDCEFLIGGEIGIASKQDPGMRHMHVSAVGGAVALGQGT
jgi:hypothetical protein